MKTAFFTLTLLFSVIAFTQVQAVSAQGTYSCTFTSEGDCVVNEENECSEGYFPGICDGDSVEECVSTGQCLGGPPLARKVSNLYNFALGAGTILALGIFVYAGVRYAASGGSSTAIGDARKWMTAAVLGLLILFGSYVFLKTINPDLLTLRDPTTPQNEPGIPPEPRITVPGTNLTCEQVVAGRGGWETMGRDFCVNRVRTGMDSLTRSNVESYLNTLCGAAAATNQDVSALFDAATSYCGDAEVGGTEGDYTINVETIAHLCSYNANANGVRVPGGELFTVRTLAVEFDLDREIYALDQTPIGGYTAEYKNAFRTSVLPYNLGKLIEYCGSHTGAICTLSGSPVTGMNDAAKTLLINTCADLL